MVGNERKRRKTDEVMSNEERRRRYMTEARERYDCSGNRMVKRCSSRKN